MSASLHPRLSGPPPRDTEYCVDCYADGGRVTVAMRKFGDDALCERHYLKLCKEMGIEPEVITLSEANAAKEISAKETPIKKVRKAPTPRPETGLKPLGHPGSESVAMRVASDVLRLESTEARCGSEPAAVTIENSFPSDSELAEAAQSLPSRSTDVPMKSQRPDSTVAPAAEGRRDRAHSPTPAASSTCSGVPQAPSAANPQRPQPERSRKPMPRSDTALRNDQGHRVCSCGCGTELRSRHPYIKGHNITPGKPAAGAKARVAQPPSAVKSNGHAKPEPLPPVAIANGNGHAKIAANGAYMVPCEVSEWAMDRIWMHLDPEEKAQLLFGQGWRKPEPSEGAPAHA